MKSSFIVLGFLLSCIFATAQKETTTTSPIVKLDSAQQRWLKANYLLIVSQSEAEAKITIKKEFPSAVETTAAFMIQQAKDVALLTQQINNLREKLNALEEKIANSEKKLEELRQAREKLSEKLERERSDLINGLRDDRIKMIELDSLIRVYKTNSKIPQ